MSRTVSESCFVLVLNLSVIKRKTRADPVCVHLKEKSVIFLTSNNSVHKNDYDDKAYKPVCEWSDNKSARVA